MKEVQDISYINTVFHFSPFRLVFKFLELRFKIIGCFVLLERWIYCLHQLSRLSSDHERHSAWAVVFWGFNFSPSLYKEYRARQRAEVLLLHVLVKQEFSCRHSCLKSLCNVTMGITRRFLSAYLPYHPRFTFGVWFLLPNHFNRPVSTDRYNIFEL